MNESSVTKIESIQTPGDWIDVKAKVVQLWDSNAESISQVGLLGDETGQIKFISWKKSKLPLLEEGESYLIKTVVVDSWQGKLQLNLNRKTEIKKIEEEVESESSEMGGIIRGIVPESGLVLRCPSCKRVLVEEGVCMVHGEVESVPDLRVKASFDADNSSRIITLNRKITENLLDVSLDEAREMGDSKLDRLIREKLVGSRFKIQGVESGKYLHVREIEPIED